MTPDERALLTGFLNDLAQARAGQKDPEAESMIKNALGSNPDGAYLLVQHAILSDQALNQAQGQIAQLQAQLQSAQPNQSTSFLGGAQRPGPVTSVPLAGGPGQGPQGTAAGYGSAPQPPYGQQQQPYGQPQPDPYGGPPPPQGPFSGGGGLGSFLRNAGTMAAGVAGGEFLFSGLSGLFGGHRGGFGGPFGGGGFGGGGFGGAPQVENVTINEYGDDRGDSDDDYDDTTTDDDWSDDGN